MAMLCGVSSIVLHVREEIIYFFCIIIMIFYCIFEQLKTINFPFDTNGKLMGLGVPILKYYRVCETYVPVNTITLFVINC